MRTGIVSPLRHVHLHVCSSLLSLYFSPMDLMTIVPPAALANKILLAGVLGGIIGIERLMGDHPAGIRTCVLICVSSCLFTIVSTLAFAQAETARIASEVVVGVGFIGGGCLLRANNHVHGLTTAATIWTVAAIGMTVGVGMYGLAIFACLFSLAVLLVLAPISKWMERSFGDAMSASSENFALGSGVTGVRSKGKK